MMAHFHRVGTEFYGAEKWETQQDTIATWISKGRAPIAAFMTAEETQAVCWIMQLKINCRVQGITEDRWKAMLTSIGLIDIAKITEKQFKQLGLLIECQVMRNRHEWTEEEWDYLVETIGVVDMAALDSVTANMLQQGLMTRHDEIRESMHMEAMERGQA